MDESGAENDDCKDAPDRRANYTYNAGLANSDHWNETHKLYATQCQHSFSLLQEKSLQFHQDYWQGVLVCFLFSMPFLTTEHIAR